MRPFDLDRPQFPQRVVAALSGVAPKTIQTWERRGVVSGQGRVRPGTGHQRLYSIKDAIEIVVLGRLGNFGMFGSKATKIARAIRSRHDWLHKLCTDGVHTRGTHQPGEYLVVTDSKACELSDLAGKIIDVFRVANSDEEGVAYANLSTKSLILQSSDGRLPRFPRFPRRADIGIAMYYNRLTKGSGETYEEVCRVLSRSVRNMRVPTR
jgi:hypothetical protein